MLNLEVLYIPQPECNLTDKTYVKSYFTPSTYSRELEGKIKFMLNLHMTLT